MSRRVPARRVLRAIERNTSIKIAEEEDLRRDAVIYARTVISPTLRLGGLTRALCGDSGLKAK
jgi:hypothetical protein